MSLRFLVVFTVAAIMKHNLQRKQRMVYLYYEQTAEMVFTARSFRILALLQLF